MRFVGLTEVSSFLTSRPDLADPVIAWLTEIKHRRWHGFEELASDFSNVDVSAPPEVVFKLASCGVRIVTLVDFRNDVVLLTSIQSHSLSLYEPSTRKEYRGH